MKIFKSLTFLFLAIVICACDNDDNEISEPDFSLLGITTITVNNIAYSINDNLLLELNDSKNIVVSGIQMTESTKHCIIEYSVIPTTQETPFVSITSCYTDVSVVVNSNTTSNGITYVTLNISRTGYNEQATYKFYFANI